MKILIKADVYRVRRNLDIVSDERTCVQENMKLARHTPAPIIASNIGPSVLHEE